MSRPRVLLLTKYGSIGASSRYRFYQYLDQIHRAGFETTVQALFPDSYLQTRLSEWSEGGRLVDLGWQTVAALVRRWWTILRAAADFDVIFLQYEALPYLPFICEEALFNSGRPVVVDYDDAVGQAYEQSPNPVLRTLLGPKIPAIIARSRSVIVGNASLGDWAQQFTTNLTVVPTSIDLCRYPWDGQVRPIQRVPVIGWIGTPATSRSLRALESPLRALRQRHDFVLKVIGAPDFVMQGVEVVAVPWSQAREVDDLQTLDIGVMPVADDIWGRGKSALKLVQYLAAGVPAVGSPVGANCDVLGNEEAGLLASSAREWTEKLAQLLETTELRRTLVHAGRRRVEQHYSIQVNGPILTDVLQAACRP